MSFGNRLLRYLSIITKHLPRLPDAGTRYKGIRLAFPAGWCQQEDKERLADFLKIAQGSDLSVLCDTISAELVVFIRRILV
jgi:hypothetical protein